MLKISFIGCSWTQGYNISYTDTYPYIVHKKLQEVNIENHVINAGRSGASWHYHIPMMKYLEKTHDPDVYVIQHTTPDRAFLKFQSRVWEDQKQTIVEDRKENYTTITEHTMSHFHFTAGLAKQIITEPDYEWLDGNGQPLYPLLKKKFGLTKEQIRDRLSYWYTHEQHHPLTFERYIENAEYINNWVKLKNKKIVNIFWFNDEFSKLAYPNKIIVGDSLSFDSFCVDEGYHFDVRGNTCLADLIMPYLLPHNHQFL